MSARTFVIALSLGLVALASEANATPPGPPPGVAYSGRAVVAILRVESDVFRIADTGELPTTGQPQWVGQPFGLSPYFLSQTLYGYTAGHEYTVQTEASTERIDVVVDGNSIRADAVRSQADATCTAPGTAAVDGSVQIANLIVNGERHTVGTEVNHTIDLPKGRLIVNEQLVTGEGSNATITVRALRLTLTDLLENPSGIQRLKIVELILSSSRAGIACP